MERLIFVDSNIWCYYFDRSSQEHNIVSDKLEQVLDGGVAINTVVELEVAHYLIKNLGSEGKRKMDTFLSYPMVVMNFDQYLARTSMEELEIDTLMTHDRAFKRIDFIEVVDPVD